MITVELDNFSLREICRSGQCFRMHETAENNTYELVAGDKYLKISQAGSIVNFYCSDMEFICYWVPYFVTGVISTSVVTGKPFIV